MPDGKHRQALDTFPRLLIFHAQRRAEKTAIREKEYGIWQTWTWAEAADNVRALACGLAELGFSRGDNLAIVGGFSSGELIAWRYETGRELWSDALARTDRPTDLSSEVIREISFYWEAVRGQYAAFESDLKSGAYFLMGVYEFRDQPSPSVRR